MVCALLAGINETAGQQAQFLRILGPTKITIIAFRPDGSIIWSNAHPGGTYTVQMGSSLPNRTKWVDYVQIPAASGVNTNQLVDFNPPTGMALIPAGSFTMGDSLDHELDAMPTVTANVSAFYMDTNLVTGSLWESVYNYATNHGYGFDGASRAKGTNYPAETVNWYDTVKWCNARSQQAGLACVYYTDTNFTELYTNGDVDAVDAN
jgi:formylglycine-generating enzyme required for sulfatase activity